jgi:tetratricopeptide (TPR) repeat protein
VRGIFRTRRRPDRALYQPEAVAAYKVTIEETRGASDDESLKKRGLAYWMLGRTAKQNEEFEDAARYSREAALILEEIPSLRAIAVHARADEGSALARLARYDEALDVLDEVVRRLPEVPHLHDTVFAELRNPNLLNAVANAAGLRVEVLDQLNRVEDADAAAEFVINAFRSGDTGPQRFVVATAFAARGRFAHRRGDLDGAVGFLDQAITLSEKDADDRRFGTVRSTALAERQAVLQEARPTDHPG